MAAFIPFLGGFTGGMANAFQQNNDNALKQKAIQNENAALQLKALEYAQKQGGLNALQTMTPPPSAFGSTVPAGQPSQPGGDPGGSPPNAPSYISLPKKPAAPQNSGAPQSYNRADTTAQTYDTLSGQFDSVVGNLDKSLTNGYSEVDKWYKNALQTGADPKTLMSMAEKAKKDIRDTYNAKFQQAEQQFAHGKDKLSATNTVDHQLSLEQHYGKINALAHINPIWAMESKALSPIDQSEANIEKIISLLNSGSPVASNQVQLLMNEVFSKQRLTNHIYNTNKSFGDVYDRTANTVARWASGNYTDVNEKMIKDLLTEMRSKVLEPARKHVVDLYRDRFKKMGVDPSFADNPNPYTEGIPNSPVTPDAGAEADAYLNGAK